MALPLSSIEPLALDSVAHFARVTPDKIAMRDLATNRQWTYAQLDDAIDRAATVLCELLQHAEGERVAVLSRNSGEMVIVHFACVRSGSIFVPLNWRLTEAELALLVDDCEPALIVHEASFASLISNPSIPRLLFDGGDTSLRARMAATPQPLTPGKGGAVSANTPITLLYSSGTTGKPKGVIVTYLNAFAGPLNLALGVNCSATSVFLCDMPLFHTAGLFATVRTPLLVGGTLLISQKFDSQITYQRLADVALNISHYFCVTQMAMMMRQLPDFDGRKLAHLTAIITGGAPNPESHILRWLDDGVMMINGWGMSETCSASAQPLDFERIRKHPSAIGLPHLTMEMKLMDTEGREVGTNEVGEIWARGANVTPGYWRRPDLNETSFQDGWFRTGDMATRDAEGYFTIVDRIKDMFISGGENVYPAEVEAAIYELPTIADVAVIGIPDAQWGEVGLAVVVLKSGEEAEAVLIEAHCRARLARFKIPRRVEFVETLPRTPSGKVQKHLLRNLYKIEDGTAPSVDKQKD